MGTLKMKSAVIGVLIGLAMIAVVAFSPINASAQVLPAQNQVIFGPYPAGLVISTSSSATHKLGATTTPFFANFTFGNATGTNATTTNFFSDFANFTRASSTYASSTVQTIGTLFMNALNQGALYVGFGNQVQTVATSTITVSTGLSYSGTMGALLGGVSGNLTNTSPLSSLTTSFPLSFSNPNLSWIGLATSSNISAGQSLYATGANTIAGTATTTLGGGTTGLSFSNNPFVIGASPSALSGTLIVANGGTGTTTAPASQLLYGGGNGVYQSTATTSVSCGGTVSCTTFAAIGTTPITITGAGGGSGTVSTSTNEIAGRLPYWTSTSGTPATLGQVSTTTLTISGPFNNSAVPVVIGASPITSTYYGLATTTALTTSQLLYSTNGAAGVSGVATSSLSVGSSLQVSGGSLGAQVGGTNATIALANAAANTVLVNQTSGAAIPTALATSTFANGLYVGTAGQVLYRTSAGTWVGTATTTAGTGLSYNGTAFNVNTSQNIATLSNLTSDGVVYTSGANGTLNVDAGALDYARGGTGSTTAPVSQLIYGGTTAYQSVATTSVSCSGSVSCTTFTAIGAAPITITGSGGGGNMSGWATTTTAGQLLLYPVDAQTTDVLFGTSATTTAPFWWDVSATTTYIGQTGTGDGSITFAPDGQATTTIGVHASSDSYRIAPGINLENPFATFLQNGKVGFGTTTPWGAFSIASSTYTSPIFSVATTSGNGFSQLLNIWATSTTQINNSALALPDTSGVRAIIGGLLSQAQLAFNFTQLYIQGWWDQADSQAFCDVPVGPIALSADGANGYCNGYSFMEDGTGTLTSFSPTNAGYTYGALSSNAANDGAGIFLNAASAGGLTIATSTPIFAADARIEAVQLATTSHAFYIGFTNVAIAGTAFETAPTQGCYFTASSSQANWIAVSRNSAANITQTNTGIASSTVTTGTGGWRRFYVVADASRCLFFLQNGQSNDLVKVAEHTNNLPTSALNAGVYMADTLAGVGALFDVKRIRVWWREFLPAG